jgi:hypothetical protein
MEEFSKWGKEEKNKKDKGFAAGWGVHNSRCT